MKFKYIFREQDLDDNFLILKKLFYKRTQYHIDMVCKYLEKIIQLDDNRIENNILDDEFIKHDDSKFSEPEFTYYLHINYKYHLKNKGIEYNPGKDIEEGMRKASYFHVKHNEHHPEFWDDDYNIDSEIINAKNMPLSYIACMLADWFAMDEETNGNIYEWTDKFIKEKCKFTDKQKEFIYDIIDRIYL